MDARLFDAHFHIIDPRFPLVANEGFLPGAFTCDDYLARMQSYRLCGGAVVAGSFQAFDRSWLLDALDRLGPSFVGVARLPADTADDEILELDRASVRGLRFNLKRGGSESPNEIESMAKRVHEIAGWHTELYIDSGKLQDLSKILVSLPAVCIDHLGLSAEGFPVLAGLVEKGVRVKATGFGRLDFDVRAALQTLQAANPEALMFGTDLPSTRAPRPYDDADYRMVVETLGEEQARRVLYDNAVSFYRPTAP